MDDLRPLHETDYDAKPDPAQRYPDYVRVLAMGYVLSHIVGPLGFFILGGVAGFLWYRRELNVDSVVLGTLLAAWAMPLSCAAFRWWFRSWGRRHYPPEDPDPDRNSS